VSIAVSGEALADVAEHALVYAGRFAEEVEDRPEIRVLDDTQAGPRELLPAIDAAPMLVILDALSFPYEYLRDEHWDCPLTVCLPPSLDPDELLAALGEVLFERLEFFDRVVTDQPETWEKLRRTYGFATSQRLELNPRAVDEVVEEAVRRMDDPEVDEVAFERTARDAVEYWVERGGALAQVAPHRAVGALDHDLRANKEIHRVQARALRGQLAAVQRAQPSTRGLRVLEIGTGVGRWAGLLASGQAGFVGADVSEEMVRVAEANFPDYVFSKAPADLGLSFPEEGFDLAFTVTVLQYNPPEVRSRLIAEMWRLVRPGGSLMFLEDFVAARAVRDAAEYSMSVQDFPELILEATGGAVVLEHVEALRYPRDDFHRSGLITLTKLGVPRSQ